MTKWTRISTFILLGIILLNVALYGIGYLLLIKPLQEERNSVQQQLDLFESHFESSSNSPDESDMKEFSNLMLEVPNKKVPDHVLLNLQELASATDVVITYIASNGSESVEDTEDNNLVHTSGYAIDVTANNLGDANTFIDSILDLDLLIVIDSMFIDKNDDSVELNLMITTFYANY
ncbi:hypothetical protein [Paucisalibacillus sp. EB02]|uniref:hypothetical protein n=1 Tax=Paucisalibacillus sp. EB02 TaxID=1347087 RepID=UPI0004BA277A|nr:hypothetical protein [Paucisalibacillus sp. EB02]